MKYYEVRFVANDGDIRWMGVEAESEDEAWSKAWEESAFDYGDGGIFKIIDVRES